MKISYNQICINPTKPTKQSGFAVQVKKIYQFHDDLHARILGLDDGTSQIYFISADSLGMPCELELWLSEQMRRKTGKDSNVTISCTHDHFAGDARDEDYQAFLKQELLVGLENLTWIDAPKLKASHQHCFFDGVGHSRISTHDTKNIFVDLVSFYNSDVRLGTIITYNCHPTIHNGDTPYFTAEYPGYVINHLQEQNPGEFFTFFQGAAGDVSSRFTRKSQDYVGMMELGDKLVNKVQDMLKEKPETNPVTLHYEFCNVPLIHQLGEMDYSKMPENLAPRELETIEQGKVARENLLSHPEKLQKEIMLSLVDLGAVKFIFSPKEMFSYYINALDTAKSILVCYSNGYSPYMVDIGFVGLTYELFTDTTTEECKKNIYKQLEQWGH